MEVHFTALPPAGFMDFSELDNGGIALIDLHGRERISNAPFWIGRFVLPGRYFPCSGAPEPRRRINLRFKISERSTQ